MIIGYGWIFVFAGLGAILRLSADRSNGFSYPLGGGSNCAYLHPLDFQRRLTQGLHVPLALLAAFALWGWEIFGKIRTRFAWVASPLVATFVFLVGFAWTNLYMIGRDFALFHDRPYDIFTILPECRRPRRGWKAHEREILAHPISANLLVGMSGRGTYVGHGVETLRFTKKLKRRNHFIQHGRRKNKGRF